MINKIIPADISDPQKVIARAKALSVELGTPITPGFKALVFKATRGIEDIYELTYIRKDGTRFPANCAHSNGVAQCQRHAARHRKGMEAGYFVTSKNPLRSISSGKRWMKRSNLTNQCQIGLLQ